MTTSSRTTSSRGSEPGRMKSCYLPAPVLQEMQAEAARVGRTLSWVVRRAWKLARLEIKKLRATEGT